MTSKQDKRGRSCYFNCDLNEDTVLHRLIRYSESTAERFNAWISVLDEETRQRGVYSNIFLCYRHFEKCYLLPSNYLTRNAIPTLNLVHQLPGSQTEQQDSVVETKSNDIVLIKTESEPVPIQLDNVDEKATRPEPVPMHKNVKRVYKRKAPPAVRDSVSTENVPQATDAVQVKPNGDDTRILSETGGGPPPPVPQVYKRKAPPAVRDSVSTENVPQATDAEQVKPNGDDARILSETGGGPPPPVPQVYKRKAPPAVRDSVSTENVPQATDAEQNNRVESDDTILKEHTSEPILIKLADTSGRELGIVVAAGSEPAIINKDDGGNGDTILKQTGSEPVTIKQENVTERTDKVLNAIRTEPETIILDDSESEDNGLNAGGSESLIIKQEDDNENYEIIFMEQGSETENIKQEGPENYSIIFTEPGIEPETIEEGDESKNEDSTLKEMETEAVTIDQTDSNADKNGSVTLSQCKAMLEYIKAHPTIASGGCLDDASNRLLNEMTKLLNNLYGATKTPEQWLIVWNVWKFLAMKKVTLTLHPSREEILSACETVLDQELVDFLRSMRDPAKSQNQVGDQSKFIIILPNGESQSQQEITVAQRQILLNFIKTHPIIDTPSVEKSKRGRKILNEMSKLLNNMVPVGSNKTPATWLEIWRKWKTEAKTRTIGITRRRNPQTAKTLIDLDFEVLDYIHEQLDSQDVIDLESSGDEDNTNICETASETDTGNNHSQSKKRKLTTEKETDTGKNHSQSKKRKLTTETENDTETNYSQFQKWKRTTFNFGNRSSIVQLKLMLDFVKEHPIIAAGHYRNSSTKRKLLDEMAELLNGLGSSGSGAVKSPKLWHKTWFCWKSNTKLKAEALARHAARGDSAAPLAALTDLERELLDVLRDMPRLLTEYLVQINDKRKLPNEKKDDPETEGSSSKHKRTSEKFKDTVSIKQRKLMLEFVKKHPILATDRFSESIHHDKILEDMAQFLNPPAAEGATMTPDQWFKAWQTWKAKINIKAVGVAWHAQNPGTSRPPRLTDVEQELVDFLKNLPDAYELIQEEAAKKDVVTPGDEGSSTDDDVPLKNIAEKTTQSEKESPQKHKKVSVTQKKLMLEFMKKHPDVAASRNSDLDDSDQSKVLEELADLLNNQQFGAVRTPWKWLRTWEGWRINTKMKALKNPPVVLSDLELELVQFVNSLKKNKEDDWRSIQARNLLKKNMRVSTQQRKLMLDFIKKYPVIIAQGTIQRRTRARLLVKLANLLNRPGRAVATSQQWLRSWADWKYATLRKADAIAKHAQCRAAGSPPKHLTDLEQEMIDFLRNLPDILNKVREEDIEASLTSGSDHEDDDDELDGGKPRGTSTTIKRTISKSGAMLQRPTFEQRKLMFDFIKQHPIMATRKFAECKHRTKLMNDMAAILNQPGIEGPVSTPLEWLKSWQRWKCKIKWKSKMREHRLGVDPDMKDLEQQVLEFLDELPDPRQLLRSEEEISRDEENSKMFEGVLLDDSSCSISQLKLMLNFIKKYPVMATECFENLKNCDELNDMTNRLNGLGDTKTSDQWLKIWYICSTWSIKKSEDLAKQPRRTKGATLECLSDFEKELLDFVQAKNCGTSMDNDVTKEDLARKALGHRTSTVQLKLMLDFMKQHPAVAAGRLYELQQRARLLRQLEELLNAEASTGARKDARLWLKTWHAWTKHTINKAEAISQYVGRRRPDVDLSPATLTDLQQELLDFLQDLPNILDGEQSECTGPTIDNMDDSSEKRNVHKKNATTYMQRKLMLEFIRKHPIILSRGRSPERTKLLKEMADILNSKSCNGLTRRADHWLDVWHNWKSYVKKKADIISRNPDDPPVYLSDLDKQLLDIVNTSRDPCDQVMDNEEKQNRRKFQLLQDERRKMVLQVYNYFETEYELLSHQFGAVQELTPLAHTIRRTADAIGVSKTTVMDIIEAEAKRQALAERQGQKETAGDVEEKILSEGNQSCLDGGSLAKEEIEESPIKVRLKFEDPLPEEFDDSELLINDIQTPPQSEMESLDTDMESLPDTDIHTHDESDMEHDIERHMTTDILSNTENITDSSKEINLVKIEVINDDSETNTAVTKGYKRVTPHNNVLGDKAVTEHQGTSKETLDYEDMITKYHDMSNEVPVQPIYVDYPMKIERKPRVRRTQLNDRTRSKPRLPAHGIAIPSPRPGDDLNLMETEDVNLATSEPHSSVTISQDDLKLEMSEDGLTLWTSDFVKLESLENNSESEEARYDMPWRFSVS